MTDFLLALVPDYGLYIVISITFLAAMGIPLPASVVALTAGGLAATGDLLLLEVLLVTLLAFVTGDQLAYTLGSWAKPEWLRSARESRRIGPLFQRSESLYNKHGLMAVLMSRTIVSPVGPWIAYFSGALKMHRVHFSAFALLGAVIWTTTYVMLGYTFTGNLPQISDLVAGFTVAGVAALFVLLFTAKLVLAWKRLE